MKTEKLNFALNIICAGVILFNAFSVSLLKLDLEMQRDFIAEVFCINKDKPKMSCNGQCFINKELKKESKKQKESTESMHKEFIFDVVYTDVEIVTEPVDFFETSTLLSFGTTTLTSKDKVDRLLRPPIV